MLKSYRSGLVDFALKRAVVFRRSFLPVSGKTNALNFGVRGRAPLCRFMIMHDFQLANNDVPVFVPLSPFLGNIL